MTPPEPAPGADAARPRRGRPLAFDPPVLAPGLPLNYMPAALPALRDEPEAGPRSIIPAEVGEARTRFALRTKRAIADIESWTQGSVLIGPPLRWGSKGARHPVERCFCRADAPLAAGRDARALVVVDHGIAFWAPRLCDDGGRPFFQEVQVLGLDPGDGDLTVGRLRRDELCALAGLARAPGGEARVWRELGERFPGSFFGRPHPPAEIWHGTAMADVALRRAGRGTLAYGVELPNAVVEDWGGDTLTAFLPTAFAAALEMTAPVWEAGGRVTVLLASGHQAGPHDGSHPAARALGELLRRAQGGAPTRVSLVLPMGNGLQHRGVARLQPGEEIALRVPADDVSPTTVEVCLPATGGSPTLVVEAPDGGCAEAPCRPETFQALKRDGAMIGGVHALPLPPSGGFRRMRLSLAPTAWRHLPPEAPPAPCGDWRLTIEGAAAPADLWILGDDTRGEGGGRAPRPATFAHPGWRDRGETGDWLLGDRTGVPVRRRGSASVLTTAPGIHAAAALERRGERLGLAPYSARPLRGHPKNLHKEVVEDRAEPQDPEGTEALGSSLDLGIRLSGTSVAAALVAGRLAAPP